MEKTINLNTHLVIPIPEIGFTKKELAEMVAEHFDYKSTKKEVEQRTFTGTPTDFKDLFDAITSRKAIIQSKDINNTEIEVIYQVEVEKPADLTKVEFGIYKATKQIGDLIRRIIEEKAMEAVKPNIEQIEQQAKQQADQLKQGIDGIKAF